MVGPEEVNVIKRGSSFFSLNFRNLSFRDAMNYTLMFPKRLIKIVNFLPIKFNYLLFRNPYKGPMSSVKFANVFDLQMEKGLFPYELFNDISQLKEQKCWPKYKDFQSSLPSKPVNFIDEIDDILSLPIIFSFENFGELLRFFEIDINLTENQYFSELRPILSEEQEKKLSEELFLSPKEYFEQKFQFERKIESGLFTNYIDHLKFYNEKDSKFFFSL